MKFGKAFADNVLEEKKSTNRFRVSTQSWWLGTGRVLLFTTLFFVAFFVLALRLFQLTVIKGHEFRVLSDSNRIRERIRHAARGRLLDRTGKPLVTNIPRYRLTLPCEEKNSSQTSGSCVRYVTEAEGLVYQKEGLPTGAYLEVDWGRQYEFPYQLSHILGYTSEVTESELTKEYFTLRHFNRGDRIGRVGAEAVFEERLRGRDGRELVEVDSSGASVRRLGVDPESAGVDVTLSIDSELTQVVADNFPKDKTGAVIVTKPGTGEVLVIYSHPSFDPNKFTLGMTEQEYNQLLEDPSRPLFDRAIGGVYPPGSTFKLVTAIAGLEEGVITEGTTVEDVGELRIGPFSFPNWFFVQYGKTEGIVNLVSSLKRSNDIYFYKAGEWLGISKLKVWAEKMGVGKPTGIELSGEASGLMPDPIWKNLHFTSAADREARNHLWYLGDTYHASIGQGYVLTTPLQVNTWTNVIANGGKLCRPTIEKISMGNDILSKDCVDLGLKDTSIGLITEGMRQACDTGGTGWPLFDFKVQGKMPTITQESTFSAQPTTYTHVPIACKTGTAEFGDPDDKTHAWFTAFAPIPNELASHSGNEAIKQDQIITGEPEISITVLVEEGGEGSSVAAPIAKKIFEAWFSR